MNIDCPAFADGETIPTKYSCEGEDVSPQIRWSDVPADSVELMLIVDDPDAPNGTWVHWVLAGIDGSKTGLAEGEVPAGTVQGINGFGNIGWGGPCPPKGHGPHRYYFTLYALLAPSGLANGVTANVARLETKDKVLAIVQTMGRYEIR